MKSRAERWEERFMARRAMAAMIERNPRFAQVYAATKLMDLQREQQERVRKRK